MTTRPTIVFVHGMYLNGRSWQPWMERAGDRGFGTIAPSWPFHAGDPAALRETIDPALGRLTFGEVVASLKTVIDALPERPLLVGHSIGGLVTQQLVADGYARAAVAISSAPPQGVLTLAPDFLMANWPHLNPFAGNRAIRMTKPRFHYTFATTMTRAAADARGRHRSPDARGSYPDERRTLSAAGAGAHLRGPRSFHLQPAGLG